MSNENEERIVFLGDIKQMRRESLPFVPGMPQVIIERVHADAVIPTYTSEGDSGMDVYAVEDVLIYPQDTELLPLGFKMQIPRHPFHDLGYRWEAQVRPRSGVSLNTNLIVTNAPGTVDNFYTDEVKVIIRNTSETPYLLKTVADSVIETKLTAMRVPSVFDLKRRSVYDVPQELQEESYPFGTYLIRKGERIAQLVFNEVIRPLSIVEGIVDGSNSRGGGFGHSGLK